jgi:hypothetical protein
MHTSDRLADAVRVPPARPASARRIVRAVLVIAAGTTAAFAQPTSQAPRAQVGPLEAWTARGDTGTCQLRLRNQGGPDVMAWTVTVRSEQARHTTQYRHDGWRDDFHLPAAALRIPSGETKAFTVREDAARGDLTVRIHLLVLADGVAHGMPEPAAFVGSAAEELRRVQERRSAIAAQALAIADKAEAAIRQHGVQHVLRTALASSLLDTESDWNWWRIDEAVRAAEARLPDAAAAADLDAALDLLREAHRQGTSGVTLQPAEPMRPEVVGTCGG